MTDNNYDKDLYEFFSKLIDEPEELNLLKSIMSGIHEEKIIEEYIKSTGDSEND